MQYSPLGGFVASLRRIHCDLMTMIAISAKMTSSPISSMFIAVPCRFSAGLAGLA